MNDETPRKLEARRGFSVFYKGKTLLSTIDPASQSERVIAAAHKVPRTLFFCPSPLYGYGLETLLTMMSDDSALLCVEADEALMSFTLREIFPELLAHPRFRLVSTQDPQALCAYVKNEWGSRAFRRIETLHTSGGWQLYPELYHTLAKALQRDIAVDWGNAVTLMNLGRRYALNFFRNLPLLLSAPSIEQIDFGNKPLLVLGAGPSLDDFLEALPGNFAEKDDRPFGIICVDTALSALKARNVAPDLVIALEAQHWNLRDFIGMGAGRIPLAMDLSALPETSRQLGSCTFLFTTPWAELSIFRRLRDSGLAPLSILPLGSVGLSAVFLALKISSGAVITAGLDFSFTPDGFHAKETPSWKDLRQKQTRFRSIILASLAFRKAACKITAKNGASVFTDPGLQNYRDLFQQEFSSENRLRDINGSGLPLGVKTISVQDAVRLLSEGDTFAKADFSSTPDEKKHAKVTRFIRGEHQLLLELRACLTGEKNPAPGELGQLLLKTDYLWAHFPDYAGKSAGTPAIHDLSFLKRVRAEIDPFLKICKMIDAGA